MLVVKKEEVDCATRAAAEAVSVKQRMKTIQIGIADMMMVMKLKMKASIEALLVLEY